MRTVPMTKPSPIHRLLPARTEAMAQRTQEIEGQDPAPRVPGNRAVRRLGTVAAGARRLSAVLLLLLAPAVAQAYTIMAYVYAVDDSHHYLLSAVEAGVMDVFFDAGHIIFNAGTYERVSDSETQLRYWVRNTARTGGASHAIELKVSLSGVDSDSGAEAAAEWVEYRLTRLEPEEVIARGRIEAPAAGERTAHDRRAFQLGIEAGQAALRR